MASTTEFINKIFIPSLSLESPPYVCVSFDQIRHTHHQRMVRAFDTPPHRAHCNLHRSRYELLPKITRTRQVMNTYLKLKNIVLRKKIFNGLLTSPYLGALQTLHV